MIADSGSNGKYDSDGKMRFRAPAPDTTLGDMTGGDDGLIAFTHTEYNSDGYTTGQHSFELNHDDYDGINIGSTTSYVRRSAYVWQDAIGRTTTTADYGSGDSTAGSGAWKYAAVPTRPGTAPTASSETKLVATMAYNADTGRLETTTDPADKISKVFYDDAGRRIYIAENYTDFAPPSTGLGGGTNNEDDRVTFFKYNGLGQTTNLVAFNGTTISNDQTTLYFYEDTIDASRVTNEVYPDSGDSTSGGTDQIKMEYNVDGSLKTRTDQREVVLTYVYDERRRLTDTDVTSLGAGAQNVDGAIRSIGSTYDLLNRLTKKTSYDKISTESGRTVENEIEYVYVSGLGRVRDLYQNHNGAVNITTSPKIEYIFDTSTSAGGVFDDSARVITTWYRMVTSARLINGFGKRW